MRGSLRLGRIAGISIEVHVSWLLIFALLTWSLATGWFPVVAKGYVVGVYWSLGAFASLLLFASVLAHELSHALVGRARGIPVSSITLFVFGGVSNIEREPASPGAEFQMAFVGPLTSLLLGVLAGAVWYATSGVSPLLTATLLYVATANLLLGVFNLIPGFPLDGGRVLRSILWKLTGNMRRATCVAGIIGQIVAYGFILVGIWMFFTVDVLNGLWLAFVGWFLAQAAQAESAQVRQQSTLAGVTVPSVMSPPPPACAPTTSLGELAEGYFLRSGIRAVPVVAQDQVVGVVTLSDLRRIPREQWSVTPVTQVMTPRERLWSTAPDQPLSDAIDLLVQHHVNQLPVVANGRLVGILSLATVAQLLEVRHALGALASAQPAQPQLPKAS
jgi:Zn-dependent protease/CBS domain-containing protein